MAQNDVVAVEVHFLLLCLLVEISLRITWDCHPNKGGNYACLQEKAYHIAPHGFNARVIVACIAGPTSLP